MRVLLVHATPLGQQGGAEISLRLHVQAAPPDVTVDAILPGDPAELDRYDAVVLANLRPNGIYKGNTPPLRQWVWDRVNQSPLHALAWRPELSWTRLWIERLQGFRGRVIRSERDVHPCALRSGVCLSTEPLCRQQCQCSTVVPETIEELYNACDMIHFLSPLHRQAINALIRIDVPQCEIAVPLDFDRFRCTVPFEHRRPAALVMADAIRTSSEAEAVARQHGYTPEWVDYHSVPYEEMPALLNRYRAVVMHPIMLHAFGRLAAEALACGCEVLANSRVGAMSWPDPLQACRESNQRFWDMVMGAPASVAKQATAGS